MKRKLRKIVLIVLAVLVIAVIVLLNVIDDVAAAALTKGVSRLGEVPCQVDEVDVSLSGGSVGVRALAIGNPEGYPEADLFSLERADVDVRIRSLWKKPVHINKLEIVKPRIRVEAGRGGSNVKVFLDTIRKNVSREPPAEPTEPTRLIVDRLLIQDATIEIGSPISEQGLPITLQTVELPPVRGENDQGVTPAELASIIVEQLLEKGLIQDRLEVDLERILPKDAAERVGELIEAAGEAIKKAKEVLEELLEPKDKKDE